MRRTQRMLAMLTVATVVATGCTSGDDAEGDAGDPSASPAATESDAPRDDGDVTVDPAAAEGYRTAVEERCAQVNDEITALEEQYPEQTPEAAMGYLEGFASSIDGFVADVRAMDAPPDLAEGTDAVLDALMDSSVAFRDAAEEIEGGADVEEATGPAFGSLGPAEAQAAEVWDIALSSCGEEEVVADPDAAQVEVTATDYAFDIPEVTSGPNAFTMTNEGEEPHFMVVVRLKEGATISEALEAEQSGGDPDAFIDEEVGDSSTAAPGDQAVLNADLDPGTYAMLCFISNAEGVPHAALGMAQEFTVE